MNRALQIRGIVSLVVLLGSILLLVPTWRAASFSDEQREEAKLDPALNEKIQSAEEGAIRLGLDLQGGMYLVLEVQNQDMSDEQAADALQRVREIITNRVDQFGVSEPVIQTVGTSRIIVQLPGLQDPERARNLIGQTARLDFRLERTPEDYQEAVSKLDEAFRAAGVPALGDSVGAEVAPDAVPESAADDAVVAAADSAGADTAAADPYGELPDLDTEADLAADETTGSEEYPFSSKLIMMPDPQRNKMYVYVPQENVTAVETMLASPEARVVPRGMEFQFGMDPITLNDGTRARELYLVSASAALTGDQLTSARAAPDAQRPGNWQIRFNLDRKGARQFAKFTGENVGRGLAISLDGRVKSAPVIEGRIPGGQGVITGSFTNIQASDLALLLRAGALPAEVTIAEERTVGPSLGHDSIRQGVNAALWGSVLVIIFMILYYRATGLIVVFALVANILILLAVLAQFGLVLTLPGIAGIILTVGMAVDANVLINERIREELRKAKTVRAAVQSGYQNATRTIVDANLTTLIVGLVLWSFGTGPVLGFAVTLCIGIGTSMFAALVLARTVMEWIYRNKGHVKVSI